MQVEGQREASLLALPATGVRVRNAYRTYLTLRDSPAKAGLIPGSLTITHDIMSKDLLV